MASPEQIQTPEIRTGSQQDLFDRAIHLLPAHGYYELNPGAPARPDRITHGDITLKTNAFLVAFRPDLHPRLKERAFADEIERTLGFKCDTNQSTFAVPRTFVDGERIIKNSAEIEQMEDSDIPGEIAGYFGIRLYREGVEEITPEDTAAIAAMIAERYEGDETLRTLHNYTNAGPNEPIEITGPGYNLAQRTTAEHPAIEIEDLVREHPEVRWQKIAPDLTRVAFA